MGGHCDLKFCDHPRIFRRDIKAFGGVTLQMIKLGRFVLLLGRWQAICPLSNKVQFPWTFAIGI